MITRTDPVIFSLTQRKASRKARFFFVPTDDYSPASRSWSQMLFMPLTDG